MSDAPGYAADPDELAALLTTVVGTRSVDEVDESWYAWLSGRQALLQAAVDRVSHQRAALVALMHSEVGQSYATVAARTGLSRARVQQLVERSRGAAADTV